MYGVCVVDVPPPLTTQVREAVIAMLDAWVTVVPADRFLPQLADTITPAKCNPDGKRVAMTWLTSQVDSKTLSSVSDIESLLRICASAVKDKKNDVRADGEALVAAIVGKCGHGDVTAATGGLDAATKTIATEVLQKHMAMAPAPAAAHVPRIPSAAGLRGEEGGVRPLTARGGGGAAGHKRGGGHSRGGTSAGGASAGGGMSVGDIDGCLLVVNDRKEDRARKVCCVCVCGMLHASHTLQFPCPLLNNKKQQPNHTVASSSACKCWKIRTPPR